MVEKEVNIVIVALSATADRAVVTEYREAEDVVVFDLYEEDDLIAKSRYSKLADAPFELTEDDIENLNTVEEVLVMEEVVE